MPSLTLALLIAISKRLTWLLLGYQGILLPGLVCSAG